MQVNFKDLYELQQTVNNKVSEKMKYQPDALDYIVAAHVEVFEFINKIGVWKWWKHNHNLDKEKILDELADVMAFFLSYLLAVEAENPQQDKVDTFIGQVLDTLKDYDPLTIIKSISYGIEQGTPQRIYTLMAQCIFLANRYVSATWEEIEQAYKIKSAENIARQERNY
jgi:dimeric dUTPase (all-alpha-NTP-PPase superfamily)